MLAPRPRPAEKKVPRTGPPDRRQEMALVAVDRAFTDLSQVLTSISGNHTEMQQIIGYMQGPVMAAKKWILEN